MRRIAQVAVAIIVLGFLVAVCIQAFNVGQSMLDDLLSAAR